MLSFACNNTADGMRKDAEEARQEAREETAEAREAAREAAAETREEAAEAREDAAQSADRAGNAVERAADRTADAARDVARETGQAARNAGSAAGAAIETMDVKTALMADSRVDASNINVDTNHASKTVTLKGHVPTAAQKATAEQIAAKQATGYRVVNQLVVRG
jgi:osmotically-inducible protein OsmY